ncbi:hypothetical protein MKX01_009784, partial [Papaver californicum]
MAHQLGGTDEVESLRYELTEIGRSIRSSFRHYASSFRSISSIGTVRDVDECWAAIDRLPTFTKLRTSLFYDGVDVKGKRVINKLINHIENDNLRLLQNIRERIDKVGLKLPAVEVRYTNLSVEAECQVVHGKPFPTLWNSLKSVVSSLPKLFGVIKSQEAKISIIKYVSGIIKPGRMTLLLGPPGCGKTTFLLALSVKLDPSLNVTEEISYNGYKLEDFVPQKTSAYISQHDLHIPEMTVREALDFSACCQGVGSRAVSRILGLDIYGETLVGDAMRRGLSGGQKKRLTTGEMIVGPTKAVFMDEISNGWTQLIHITDATALISLLQPAPETYDLFDDVILMVEGSIIYHGPWDYVLEFLEDRGFKCPERKGAADFLQEVISRKDQGQHWHDTEQQYSHFSVDQFSKKFKAFKMGKKLDEELSKPNGNSLKLPVIISSITMTFFLRTRMHVDEIHANYYLGALFYALIILMVDGFPELSMTASRLAVFYKQRELCFYPAWAYAIPAAILKVPLSFLEAIVWTALTYYVIGYSPEFGRFVSQFVILFAVHLSSISMFRCIASLCQTVVASTVVVCFRSYFPCYLEDSSSHNTSLNTTLGRQTLESRGLNFNSYFYWVSLVALLRFSILFNIGFTLALTFLNRGMVLPFVPLTVVFRDVQYFIDTPSENKIQLLRDITGTFMPGVLTALMGVSGAGKTTLMDVLSGRKTGGTIEGNISIGGYPKSQKTYSRVSGYCEQTDIHSPLITVEESVIYSAWLRLPCDIGSNTRDAFVKEVIETIELDGIKDALVGVPGVSGLSIEQRKQLTIAVELVANPSIIFMDEPTSGLDARAAAIVIRAVRNVVNTGRTIVCTIHQPSINIFEAFDELILMKSGGRIIYSGLLGQYSSKVIEYFESISGVPRIRNNYNPATWVLEVTSTSGEIELGIDFANLYRESILYKEKVELVKHLCRAPPGSKDLCFAMRYPQSGWGQLKACLWKQNLSYWRSPAYNLMRIMYLILSSLLLGLAFWQQGKKIHSQQSLFSVFGSMYSAVIFLGINNCVTVLPFVSTERSVLYQERFVGMYSSWVYVFAQVAVEIPYLFTRSLLYVIITYPMIGFMWSPYKVFWNLYAMFCMLLYFNYLGMLVVSITPNVQVAAILSASFFTMLNLFSGFPMLGNENDITKINSFLLKLIFYGDMETEILVFGETNTVSHFLRDYFGFHHNHLPLVSVLLLAYPVLSSSLFAYCIQKMNFHR